MSMLLNFTNCACVDIHKSKNYKISRFIDGFRSNIQEEMFKQSHSTLFSAIQVALKIEAQLSKKGTRNPMLWQSSAPSQKLDLGKQKIVTMPHDV